MRFLILCLGLLVSLPVSAANWCVRSSAVGSSANTGVDWNNAWTNFGSINWASISAGDTIWLAGGSYIGYRLTPGANGTSNSPIFIRRVVSTDTAATALAGWNSSFDSLVTCSNNSSMPFIFEWNQGPEVGNYVWLDGRTNYGIRCELSDVPNSCGVRYYTGSTGTVITNVDFHGPGNTNGFFYNNDVGAVYFGSDGGGVTRNAVVSHCRSYDIDGHFQVNVVTNITIEYCKLWNSWSTNSGVHDNVFYILQATNVTIRNCDVANWGAEGVFMTGAGTPPSGSTNPPCVNILVYDNVFHDCALGSSGGTGRFIENRDTTNQVFAYNNTVYNVWAGIRLSDGNFTADSKARNNIFYQIALGPNPSGTTTFDQDYSYAASGSGLTDAHGVMGALPFVSTSNFQLASSSTAINAGNNAFVQGSVDYANQTRIVNTTVDIGAYEYQGAQDPSISVQPQNQTVTAPATATFSVTASGGSTLSYQWNWYGTNVTGATSASWTTPATVTGNNGSTVYVTVTDTAGSLQSANATLFVSSGASPASSQTVLGWGKYGWMRIGQ